MARSFRASGGGAANFRVSLKSAHVINTATGVVEVQPAASAIPTSEATSTPMLIAFTRTGTLYSVDLEWIRNGS